MKFLILCLVLVTIGLANADISEIEIAKANKTFNAFSTSQRETIYNSYELGKENDLGLTTGAISWQESEGGKFQININTNNSYDCGLFGNNTSTVLDHAKTKKTLWNKKMVCTKLIKDPLYAYSKALKEIKLWTKHWSEVKNHTAKWYNIWGSYNGGGNPNLGYAKDIHIKTIVLSRNLGKLRREFKIQ